MTRPRIFPRHAHDNAACLNTSSSTPFSELVAARISRRQVLGGSLCAAFSSLVGCDGKDRIIVVVDGAPSLDPAPQMNGEGEGPEGQAPGDDSAPGGDRPDPEGLAGEEPAPGEEAPPAEQPAVQPPERPVLGFTPVSKGLQDFVKVPEGYLAFVLTAVGDPIDGDTSDYANDGSDGDFARRIGDHGDALVFFPFPKGSGSSAQGLLVQNHEAISDDYIHAEGPTNGRGLEAPRPLDEVIKEQEAHGISLVMVTRDLGAPWIVDRTFAGNRRWHVNSEFLLSGPAVGSEQMVTRLSPGAESAYGTLNNCGNGYTPWGTYLSGEENWAAYFARGVDSGVVPGRDERFARYGIAANNFSVDSGRAPFNYRGWDRVEGGDDLQARFNATASGDGPSDDFRNEPNHFGWVVEVDPYDPEQIGRKRTALGRCSHEGAWFGPVSAGQPVAVYMGDDSRNEYLYKFVSSAVWDPADATAGLAAGDKYLGEGTLYAARFAEDGSGEWVALSTNNPALASFADLADIVINARLSADAAGATPMDRPEWGSIDPLTGEFYLSLTNNTGRGSGTALDAANPRASNANGHILRLREAGDLVGATTFRWDIYLFGAPANADASTVNVSALNNDNDFSSPDGLWFDTRGVLWIQTDDQAYANVSNCMMLAAVPGRVGDGGLRTIGAQTTFVGRPATSDTVRRFLVGVPGCEITGVDMTPDHTTLFVGIQHPGEAGNLTTFQSNWPAASGADATLPGEPGNRPRSATIAIMRLDGGEIAI
ncbi:MAG: alkaline phosphatase PhoX [Polyangiaceae bacterium]